MLGRASRRELETKTRSERKLKLSVMYFLVISQGIKRHHSQKRIPRCFADLPYGLGAARYACQPISEPMGTAAALRST